MYPSTPPANWSGRGKKEKKPRAPHRQPGRKALSHATRLPRIKTPAEPHPFLTNQLAFGAPATPKQKPSRTTSSLASPGTNYSDNGVFLTFPFNPAGEMTSTVLEVAGNEIVRRNAQGLAGSRTAKENKRCQRQTYNSVTCISFNCGRTEPLNTKNDEDTSESLLTMIIQFPRFPTPSPLLPRPH